MCIRDRHKGVLLGAPITDIRVTLLAGRAHLKHTEGGDFRDCLLYTSSFSVIKDTALYI